MKQHTTPRPPDSKKSLMDFGSSHSHCERRQRYPTTYLSHSLVSLSEVLALERESNDNDRFSLSIWSKVWVSSSSGSSTGADCNGAPSAGTKKVFEAGAAWISPGTTKRAKAFARDEERRRWANNKVARCVEMTFAGSRAVVVLGGEARACRRGVGRGGWAWS